MSKGCDCSHECYILPWCFMWKRRGGALRKRRGAPRNKRGRGRVCKTADLWWCKEGWNDGSYFVCVDRCRAILGSGIICWLGSSVAVLSELLGLHNKFMYDWYFLLCSQINGQVSVSSVHPEQVSWRTWPIWTPRFYWLVYFLIPLLWTSVHPKSE